MSFAAPSTDPTADLTGRDKITAAATASAGPSRCSPSSDKQCVHLPCHGHGEHGAADQPAPTSTSSSGSTSSESTRPVPVARLYRHALESILAFSDAKTLMAALRVSKEWLAAVGSMRALALRVECITAPVESVTAPVMARHVADLRLCAEERTAADGLGCFARLMPHLRRLECWVPEGPLGAALRFPAGLRELSLRAIGSQTSAAHINAAIDAASWLVRLELLSFQCERMDSLISFAPLAALPLLRHVAVVAHCDRVAGLTDEQADELRALPRLQSLDVNPISTALLRRLLAQPHELQWQHLPLPWPLTDDDAALLPQLPSLTALSFSAESLSSFDFLHRLPNLASISCFCKFRPDSARAALPDPLVAALSRCANVTQLRVEDCLELTAAELADLLPHLPRLQSLSLTDIGIDSLDFLAQPPMTGQLSSLTLSYCTRLPLAELRHLHELHGLRELSIDDSFNERVDPDCEALEALRPPSAALPLLRSFTFLPRIFEAEADY
jgi:hypothetical protein